MRKMILVEIGTNQFYKQIFALLTKDEDDFKRLWNPDNNAFQQKHA